MFDFVFNISTLNESPRRNAKITKPINNVTMHFHVSKFKFFKRQKFSTFKLKFKHIFYQDQLLLIQAALAMFWLQES